MITATRFIEFDAGHRVFQHESKCNHPHGHRYKAEIEVTSEDLDHLGRVIDFSKIKTVVGAWIDSEWDHAFLFNSDDRTTKKYLESANFRRYEFHGRNPTAEVMADVLFEQAETMLREYGISVVRVRIWETPNCYAEVKNENKTC